MKPALLTWTFLSLSLIGLYGQKATMDSLYNLSQEKLAANDIPGATDLLLAVEKAAERNPNPHSTRLLCLVHFNLAKIGVTTENNQSAEASIEKGLNYCTACQDTISLARILLMDGIIKAKQKQKDPAIALFKQSSAYYLLARDTIGAVKALAKIGNVLEMSGQYLEAQPYYLQFYEAAKRAPESYNFLTANVFLAGSYLNLKQPEKALFHNQIVADLAKKLNSQYEYGEALHNAAAIYKEMGQYERAYEELDHYSLYYRDTLMGKMQLDQAEEMRAKYEAEKKEAHIAEQQAQLGRERSRFWLVIGALVAALLVGALLFRLTHQLRKRNREKEFLIKEIHHRVKNNLQILSSLLHLQSRQITDDSALHAVREGQNRVDAMGLIHQKLYMGGHMARIEMKDYLEQYGQNMLDSFGIEDERVRIAYALEPLYVDLDTAIPLGLIINELVTNALKYAFPEGRQGTVTIALRKDDQNRLCLEVADDGVGQAYALKDEKSTSFGANLVQMLSKKLKGKPEVLPTERGYATRILFEKYN